MAGTIVVARVAVRVYPDTKMFRKDLQVDLKAMPDVKVVAPVEPKLDKGAAKAVKAELEAQFATEPVDIDPKLDDSKLTTMLAGLHAKMAAFTKKNFTIPLKIETDAFWTKLRMTENMLRLDLIDAAHDFRLKIQPTVEPSTSVASLRAKVNALLAKAALGLEMKARINPDITWSYVDMVHKKLQNKFDDIKAKIKPELIAREAALVWAQIKAVMRTIKVKVKPVLDNKALGKVMTALAALSGMRMGQDFFKDMWDKVKNLDKNIPKLIALIPAVATLGAALLNLGGNIVSVIYGLGQIGPIILALPTLLLGAAAGIYSFIISFRDLHKVFPGLKAEFKQLHSDMSAKFWSAAKNPMANFFTTILPKFKTGMISLSAANGRFVGSIADGFSRNAGPAMDTFFKSLITFTDNFAKAGPAIGSLMSSFMTIGADLLPGMGEGLADVTTRLAEWFDLNTKNGKIMDWIKLAWIRLGELWSVVTGIVSLVGALGRAIDAAGGTSLKSLGETLHKWGDELSSPENQKKLILMFEGAGKAMDLFWANAKAGAADVWGAFASSLSRNLPLLGAMFGTLLGSIFEGTSLAVFQAGLNDMIVGIGKAIDTLKPHITNFVGSLGGLGTFIGKMMTAFAPIIGWVLDLVSMIIDKLSGPLGDFMTTLTTNLTPILEALMPYISQMLDAFAANLPEIGKALGDMLKDLKPLIDVIGPVFVNSWIAGWNALSIAIIGLSQIIGGISSAIVWLSDRFNEFLAWLSGTASPALGKFFTDVGQAISDGFKAVFGEDGLIETIVGWIDRNIVQPVKNFLGIASPSTVFIDIGMMVVQGLINGINALIGALGGTVGSLVQAVINGGKSMASGFSAAVGNLRQWAIDKLYSLRDGGIAALNSLASGAWGAMSSFGSAVSNGINTAIGYLHGIGSAAWNAVSGLGGTLWSAGASLMQGLINGIYDTVKGVKSAMQWLTNMLPSWKGPPQRDSKLLTPAGESIMQSLIDGLMIGAKDVKAYLNDFTTELGTTQFAATLSTNGNLVASGNDANVTGANTGPSVQVTNYYPQAEPTSRTVNRALQLATLF